MPIPYGLFSFSWWLDIIVNFITAASIEKSFLFWQSNPEFLSLIMSSTEEAISKVNFPYAMQQQDENQKSAAEIEKKMAEIRGM